MGGEDLHEYDLQLCDYAIGNVQQYLREPRFVSLLDDAIWPPPLLEFLKEEMDPAVSQDRLQLSAQEFEYLEAAFQAETPELDRPWLADQHRHRRYIATVKEVRDALSPQVAEDWARECVRFAAQLEAKKVKISEGITIVAEWVDSLRRLLGAMGAVDLLPTPEGRQPTPTNPTPPSNSADEVETGEDALVGCTEGDLQRMRDAICALSDGRNAKADALIRKAEISRQRGLMALRRLTTAGEYGGFQRNQRQRYQDGRRNER